MTLSDFQIDDYVPCPACGCGLVIGDKIRSRNGVHIGWKIKCCVCQRYLDWEAGTSRETVIEWWYTETLDSNGYNKVNDPMSENRMVIIVLAYDYKQYRRKANELREESPEPVASVFANSPERLRGIEADKVITCDGFWERDDAIEIAQIANRRLK